MNKTNNSLSETISLTKNAAKRVNAIITAEEKTKKYLRISVDSGGCSGMNYNLTFDNKKRINRLKRLAPKKPNPFHFIEKVNPNNIAAKHSPKILEFSFFKTFINMSNDKNPKKLI